MKSTGGMVVYPSVLLYSLRRRPTASWRAWARPPRSACSGWPGCPGAASCSACRWRRCPDLRGRGLIRSRPTAPAGPRIKGVNATLPASRRGGRGLRCRWRWPPLSSAGGGTSRSSCRSSPCRRRWRWSRRSRPRRRTEGHLKGEMGGKRGGPPPPSDRDHRKSRASRWAFFKEGGRWRT